MRRHAFIGMSALLFAASAAATIAAGLSMAGMAETPMPGGWSLSSAWMPMCGQSWAGAAFSFVGMWAVMMVAMMLPSLAPLLWRGGLSSRSSAVSGSADWIVPASAGYLFVWTVLGFAVFVMGACLAQAAMQWPALARNVPAALGLVLLLAGASQFSEWKARQLACIGHVAANAGACARHARAAWRHGLRLGLHCCQSCAGLTTVLLAMGVMDWRAMTVVTLAISAERLAPAGRRVAQVIGAALIGVALCMLVSVGLAR